MSMLRSTCISTVLYRVRVEAVDTVPDDADGDNYDL